mgnify:CR=1 FL=1
MFVSTCWYFDKNFWQFKSEIINLWLFSLFKRCMISWLNAQLSYLCMPKPCTKSSFALHHEKQLKCCLLIICKARSNTSHVYTKKQLKLRVFMHSLLTHFLFHSFFADFNYFWIFRFLNISGIINLLSIKRTKVKLG